MIRLTKHDTTILFDAPSQDAQQSANDLGVRGFLERGDFYEEPFLEYIRSLGRRGAYVDAGGFIGTHTVYFALLCPAERVYTFEPRRWPREELQRNLRLNELEGRVTLLGKGLASAPKRVEVLLDGHQESFDCVRLDDVVEEPVAVIKIDVEGMEVEVLRGASRILTESRPVIFAEAHTIDERQAIEDCLAPYGYVRTGRVFNASPTYEFVHLDSQTSRQELERAYRDLCAVRDELGGKITDLGGKLQDAQRKYRAQGEAVARLKSQLASAPRGAVTADAPEGNTSEEIDRLQRRSRELTRRLHDAQVERDRLAHEVRRAKAQTEGVRQTLSFKLGHTLIHHSKSLRGLVRLPGALLAIRKDARSRRLRREGTTSKRPALSAGLRKSAVQRKVRDVHRAAPPSSFAPGDERPLEALAKLRVACVMDEFTSKSFGPECQLHPVRIETWRKDLEAFKPDLLFVESAWRGHEDEWDRRIAPPSSALEELLAWCNTEAKIPTVFWNKEDPVHFSTFINTAALFDYVFTTDIDCISRYKEALGHERVYLLPFACQPRMHNPIERYERKNGACFAGAYYARYPERQRDFLSILGTLEGQLPVEIFDRNFGKNDANYQFPEAYRDLIVGNLPFDQIDRAYKGYTYAINLNSIKYSQSMFARRVFEVLASGTVTLSNYSRGMRLMFGDLTVTTDDPVRFLGKIRSLSNDPIRLNRYRLAGLRKVLREHTYADRLGYVVSKVFAMERPVLLPEVVVIASARDEREAATLLEAYERQQYAHKRLVLIAPTITCGSLRAAVGAGVEVVDAQASAAVLLAQLAGRAQYLAAFVADDYYGPQYLVDLALASRYWEGAGIGKSSHHVWSDAEGPQLERDGLQYREVPTLQARASVFAPSAVAELTVASYVAGANRLTLAAGGLLGIHEFDYCEGGAAHAADPRLEAVRSELEGLREGLALDQMLAQAERMPASVGASGESPHELGPAALHRLFPPKAHTPDVVVEHDEGGTVLRSSLPAGRHHYVYASEPLSLAEIGVHDRAQFFLDVTPGLTVEIALIFLDERGDRLGHVVRGGLALHAVDVPERTMSVHLGLRVSGSGSAVARGIRFGDVRLEQPSRVLGRSDVLVLTNIYPSDDDLYRNAFVHRRVVEYARRGQPVDVFCLRPQEQLRYYEFDDVDVVRAGTEALRGMLETGQHRTVLVHFLDPAMWSVLQPHLDRLQVIVWVHGSEVQPWHRRSYNYTTQAQLDAAKRASDDRQTFWRSVLETPHPHLRLVFVSQYFADEVCGDLGITLPRESYEIIHNLIDTNLFAYVPKDPGQRTRILSIRPFANAKYANDLTVQAIVELSSRSWFAELEFLIVGDGVLFDETVAPLRTFRNVTLRRGFLRQEEIAQLHQSYGVFLCPTRMDAQGVSRDEAMASGLVPVTSAVAAVPEFVDESCGFLAPSEDSAGLARAIEQLYADPERFLRMSKAAAARVRGQSGPEQTVARELELFRVHAR